MRTRRLPTTKQPPQDGDGGDTLHSTANRSFAPHITGRVAAKVINHCGDEMLKVYEVDAL